MVGATSSKGFLVMKIENKIDNVVTDSILQDSVMDNEHACLFRTLFLLFDIYTVFLIYAIK